MLKQVYDLISEKKENMDNDYISSLKEREIIIFGAGGIGYITSSILKNKGCKIRCFVDDDQTKVGTYLNDIKIVARKDINLTSDVVILICIPSPMELYQQLLSLNYKNVEYLPIMMLENGYYDSLLIIKDFAKITKVYNLLADEFSKQVFINILKHRITMDFTYFTDIVSEKQYFPMEIFTFNNEECFVDGGAYNGKTIMDFIKETGNSFNFIYGFEPDKRNFSNLKKRLKHIEDKKLKLFKAGLYSETKEAAFVSHGNSSSHISETGNDKIALVKLDEILGKYRPTYIKLDIEGAEREALAGMKNTIKTYRPKLAVSIYHEATDLWELPLHVHNLNPLYKIYIRQYMESLYETVCYAV